MRQADVIHLSALFVALLVFALPLAPAAQKIPRLCFLTFDPGTPRSSRFDPFFQGLRDLGYVDGQTITIDYLSAAGRGEQFPALTADCLRLKADVIVVTTTPAAQAAKKATRTIPIVMHLLGDPVATAQRNRVVQLAAQHRLPGMYAYRPMVDAGGLMAYDAYTSSLQARTATYVDKILKGAKPADLPIEQPTKLELIINLKTAKALGLTISPSLLRRADQVID
jgi:ABC-type uncharacterized transport system substrate-binding protein